MRPHFMEREDLARGKFIEPRPQRRIWEDVVLLGGFSPRIEDVPRLRHRCTPSFLSQLLTFNAIQSSGERD